MEKVTIYIASYEEMNDTFDCEITHTEATLFPEYDLKFAIPGLLIPVLTGQYGSPEEFVGRLFDVQRP